MVVGFLERNTQPTGLRASEPRRVRGDRYVVLGWLLVFVALAAVGCDARSDFAALVPERAAGVTFDHTNIIDDAFPSGHAVDDVYAVLGVSRSDALAISRINSPSGDEIGAVRASGVDGETLLDAFVDNWRSEAIVERSQTDVSDRRVSILHHRAGDTTYVYRRGDVVFYAYSEPTGRRLCSGHAVTAI